MASPSPQTPQLSDPVEDERMPRWVKVFGIVALVLMLLFAGLHLTGHGMGGHEMHHFSHRSAQ